MGDLAVFASVRREIVGDVAVFRVCLKGECKGMWLCLEALRRESVGDVIVFRRVFGGKMWVILLCLQVLWR